jgi:hypothetical protein
VGSIVATLPKRDQLDGVPAADAVSAGIGGLYAERPAPVYET